MCAPHRQIHEFLQRILADSVFCSKFWGTILFPVNFGLQDFLQLIVVYTIFSTNDGVQRFRQLTFVYIRFSAEFRVAAFTPTNFCLHHFLQQIQGYNICSANLGRWARTTWKNKCRGALDNDARQPARGGSASGRARQRLPTKTNFKLIFRLPVRRATFLVASNAKT